MSANGKPSARILRWTLGLQMYSFVVKHIRGCTNPADILSRQPLDSLNDVESNTEIFINSLIANSIPKAVSFSEIFDASETNPLFQRINTSLLNNLKPYRKVKEQLTRKSGIILKDTRIVIPHSLRPRILKIAHEGHQGMTKTKALVRSKVWWPGIDNDIENEIKSCIPSSSPDVVFYRKGCIQ